MVAPSALATAAPPDVGMGARVARWGEAVVPPLLALSIVAFTLGSSSHGRLAEYGLVGRWLFLFALLGVAAVAAVAYGNRARPQGAIALATCFVGVAALSTTWSDWPRLTAARAVSVAVLLTVISLIAWLAAGRPEVAAQIAWAIAAAVSVVAAGGFVLAAVEPGAAFQTSTPWRFRGLGQNPNTVALLGAVTVPFLVWAALQARGTRRRAVVVGLVLTVQTVFLTGSRGSIIAGAAAVALQLWFIRRPLRWRVRAQIVLLGVVAFGLFGGAFIQSAVSVAGQPTGGAQTGLTPLVSRDAAPRTTDACTDAEVVAARAKAPPPEPLPPVKVVRPKAQAWLASAALLLPRAKNFWDFGGRTEAWSAAFGAAAKRPIVGYGFGTETDVFAPLKCGMKVFQGGRAENSYIGSLLELGLLGPGLLLALIGLCVARGIRALGLVGPRHRDLVLALLGAVAAGALVAIVQSYLYSAGNLATLPFWTSAFLLAALACPPRPRRQRSRSWGTVPSAQMLADLRPSASPSWAGAAKGTRSVT